jgi:hypothetical protein
VIAGRDVQNATLGAVGTRETPPAPTVAQLSGLLIEIQHGVAALADQREALQRISAAAPFTAQGAAHAIEQAAGVVAASSDSHLSDAPSLHATLQEAAALLRGIQQSARAASGGGRGIAGSLSPLVQKLDQASDWAKMLWPAGEG